MLRKDAESIIERLRKGVSAGEEPNIQILVSLKPEKGYVVAAESIKVLRSSVEGEHPSGRRPISIALSAIKVIRGTHGWS